MTEMMVGGEAFNVLVEGDDGAPVLMLAHPLGTNLHIFDRLMPALRRHFRVVRYDARGHGESVVTPGPYTLDQLGQDALGILDALGIERADWLGLSMGAVVGLQLLAHAPKRIGRAVLANVAAQLGSADTWNERIKTVRDHGIESLAPSLLENWFTRDFRDHHAQEIERIKRMLLITPAEGYAGACAALRGMDLRQAIGAITNPVLVIVGRHDPVATPDLGALVADAIAGAKFATLDTAHMSCIEDLEGFTGAAVEFLTAKSPAMAEETMHQIVEDAAPEMAAEEGTSELAQTPLPPKKPRKPRAPHTPSGNKAAEPADMGSNAESSAAPAQGHEADSEMEPDSGPETLGQAHPLAPPRRRKPRAPRKAAIPAAPAEIAVKPSQPRKRPAKKAAAKKSAARAPAKKAAVKKAAAKKAPARKAVARKAVARKAVTRKAVTRKAVAKKAVARKAPAKKAAMRKVRAAAPARKAVVKKTVAKRGTAKKTVARKAAAKRPVAKRSVAKRGVAKRGVAKRAVAKRSVAKRTAVKKAPMRKSAAKKAVARKAVVKRTQAKKAGVKKTAAKKGASRKSTLRRTSGRPASRKR